jgi:tellurite resistance-related uncharacterized protein
VSFYDEMRGVATEALTEFSQGTLKLKRHTPGAGPTHNPGAGTWAEVAVLKGAVGGVGKAYLDSTIIVETDRAVTCAVPAVEPAAGDKVEIDGVDHNVVAVKRIPEAGTAVAYKVFVRK